MYSCEILIFELRGEGWNFYIKENAIPKVKWIFMSNAFVN